MLSYAILCDRCNMWQHRLCDTGIDLQTYRQMSAGNLDLDFLCQRCSAPPVPATPATPAPPTPPMSPPPLSPPVSPMDSSFHLSPPVSPMDSSFDLTARTINAPDDVFEDSIADPDPEPTPNQEMQQAEWTVLPTGSKRGKPLLVDNRGYSYTIQKKKPYAVYWWCSVRPKEDRCTATVSQRGDDFIRGRFDHNHEATTGLLTKAHINVKIREVAKSGDYYQSSGSMAEQIYRDESEATRPCPSLPSLSQAARKINYHRQGDRPSDPTDLDFEMSSRFIPPGFLRADIKTDTGSRHLIFATDHQLKILSSSKTWYVDSTFRVVTAPFYQLLSIHAFLVSGTAMKQVPLLFTLMSRRQTSDYVAVFDAVKGLMDGTAVERMVTDFEAATWKGFQETFPGVQVKGCTFHLNQAIYRKVQNLGLATAYAEDVATNRFIKKLMALQFLDEDHILPAFNKLQLQVRTPELLELTTYINATWMRSPVWSISNWCVFGTSIRTNNDLESWHKRLNQIAGRRNVPFYRLVPMLFKEADLLPLQIRLVTDGQLERRQTKAQRMKANKFHELWEAYQESTLSVSGLLRELSRLNGPVVD